MPEAIQQHRPRRKRIPKSVAVIDANGCTGCGVCMDFCPVDCIVKLPGLIASTVNAVCEVDLTQCTGCTICVKECPWDTIRMAPYEDVLRLGLVAESV